VLDHGVLPVFVEVLRPPEDAVQVRMPVRGLDREGLWRLVAAGEEFAGVGLLQDRDDRAVAPV